MAKRSAGIVLRHLDCCDFPVRGIELSCSAVGAGFDDVLVERVECSGSGEDGIGSWGPVAGEAYSYHRVIVRDSTFHGNRGRAAKRDLHRGNGIILGDCQDSRIERCAAWGNDDLCHSNAGGPVGIWLCESTRSVIRDCVSFLNRTGAGVPDGGGFDLDGGCTGCVIEGCLSWGNDGAGYLICQYPEARPLCGNVIRDCWSIGDGRARNNGGFYVFGAASSTLVDCCTIITVPTPTTAACWRVPGDTIDLQIRNCRHLALSGAPLYPDITSRGVSFGGNTWWPEHGFSCPPVDRLEPWSPAQLPANIDEAWLATLPRPDALGVPLEDRWAAVLRTAGCDPAPITGVGARPRLRYGPAPTP